LKESQIQGFETIGSPCRSLGKLRRNASEGVANAWHEELKTLRKNQKCHESDLLDSGIIEIILKEGKLNCQVLVIHVLAGKKKTHNGRLQQKKTPKRGAEKSLEKRARKVFLMRCVYEQQNSKLWSPRPQES